MNDTAEIQTNKEFTFLCVVDDSPELTRALRFSCQRAKRVGGRVALVYVLQPVEFQHWLGVGDLMHEEAREQAEALLSEAAEKVTLSTGKIPAVYMLEGNATEELINLVATEKSISLLVLGAATGKDGPGPLVRYFVDNAAGRLRVPLTIVPGNLSDEDIDAIT
jgi:nucleotide-binding universal stress UspA family protein